MTQYQKYYNEVYLNSWHWRNLRQKVLERDGHKCLDCGATERLQVHHVLYRSSPYHSRMCDCETLCKSCHEKAHGIIHERGLILITKQIPREQKPVYPKWSKLPKRWRHSHTKW